MTAPPVSTGEMRTSGHPPWLEVRRLAKAFGGVQALDGVSLSIRRGRVHGLVGANGAGKSTLIRCLAGVVTPDHGEIAVAGAPVAIPDPHAAAALGLAFIHQEVSLIPGFDVLRNMSLGIVPRTRAGIIDWRPTRRRAQEVAERLGMRFGLQARSDDLSAADQWLVLIGRALMQDATLIAMDEPTASLSAAEAERVYAVVRDLVAHDAAVVYVSHRLDEVVELCDDITVFRDGRVVAEATRGEVVKADLVRAIVGHDVQEASAAVSAAPRGRPVLEVRGVSDEQLLRDVSLTVHAGEVVGLAGLVGAGRTELARIVYADTRAASGEILLNGRRVHWRQPADAVAAGVGYVPEERRSEALFLDRSIEFNLNIADLDTLRLARRLPLLHPRRSRSRAQQVSGRLTVNVSDIQVPLGSLSGGNQQKVVIGRWLAREPVLLILDEPSRGVDVGARAEIHHIIRELAARGTAVLAISSDAEEMPTLCDRVLVMAEGRVRAELSGADITANRIVSLSFSAANRADIAAKSAVRKEAP